MKAKLVMHVKNQKVNTSWLGLVMENKKSVGEWAILQLLNKMPAESQIDMRGGETKSTKTYITWTFFTACNWTKDIEALIFFILVGVGAHLTTNH